MSGEKVSVTSEGLIRINHKAPVTETPLYRQLLLEDKVLDYFSDPGVVRGKGLLIIRSNLGIACSLEIGETGAREISRHYSPEIEDMLSQQKEARQRLETYYERDVEHQGIVGRFRLILEDIQIYLRTRKIVTINRAGEIIG